MTTRFVEKIEAEGLHDAYDFAQPLHPGVNVIYGRNGVGKTTLLHILANALTGDYERFRHLRFRMLTIQVADGPIIRITRKDDGDPEVKVDGVLQELERPKVSRPVRPIGPAVDRPVPSHSPRLTCPVAYFPAFRAMLDAWVSAEKEGHLRPFRGGPTDFARKLFGPFTPTLSYPSLIDIERDLRSEIVRVFREVSEAETGQAVQTARAVFRLAVQGHTPVTQPAGELVKEIKDLCHRIGQVSALLDRTSDTDLSGLAELVSGPSAADGLTADALSVLDAYREALARVASAQEAATRQLESYLRTINEFLAADGKRLVIAQAKEVRVRHDPGGREVELSTLSSGERHIFTMMYAATHLSETEVVLIDEPELSLHGDWQRPLLSRMAALMGGKQLIVATHSSAIGANEEQLYKFRPVYSSVVRTDADPHAPRVDTSVADQEG